jgi:hypothetical protein
MGEIVWDGVVHLQSDGYRFDPGVMDLPPERIKEILGQALSCEGNWLISDELGGGYGGPLSDRSLSYAEYLQASEVYGLGEDDMWKWVEERERKRFLDRMHSPEVRRNIKIAACLRYRIKRGKPCTCGEHTSSMPSPPAVG